LKKRAKTPVGKNRFDTAEDQYVPKVDEKEKDKRGPHETLACVKGGRFFRGGKFRFSQKVTIRQRPFRQV